MEELLLQLMEFVIELAVVTAFTSLVTVGLSVAILYPSGLYEDKKATIIVPCILAIALGAAGSTDHTNTKEWAYFTLPALLIAPPVVSSLCYRRRLRKRVNLPRSRNL